MSKKIIIKALSSFFYVGHLPLIPGTFASIVGAYLFYLVKDSAGLYLSISAALLILGFWVSAKAEEVFAIKDPKYVVIDEVSGIFLSLLFMPYYDLKVIFCAFLLFRILDTLKPYPVWAMQRLKGSAGIMLDDIIAGIYANIVLQVVLRLASFRAS